MQKRRAKFRGFTPTPINGSGSYIKKFIYAVTFYILKINRQKNRCEGFTLIEMVTTISIISLLVAMGVPAFASYQRHNTVRIAAQDIKGFILEAQNLANNPRPEDKGRDYYFARINKSTAEISLGVGNFTAAGRRGSESDIKEPRSLGNDVLIQSIIPDRVAGGDENVGTYIFIIPTGDIMFDYREPYPGVGYSPLCETIPDSCYYTDQEFEKSVISIWLTGGEESERYLEHQVVVDGQGGDVKIIDNVSQAPAP